eukprot:CAMPEP_0185770132 /NCGR_PEP_ID=MMETSP1174-20130828/57665_1 /TAXON_ID=35687 /ORGANISM="Dictyocha speculum, Strain CCMP1381" /LENGTH=308 /DNA_ID=CAMNT_0028455453 /DNA_START=22 /DNA_END=948 /DNA_ORIENTATION=-
MRVEHIICAFVAFVVAINIIIIMSMSIEAVDSEHYALTYSPVTGELGEDVKSEGLHGKGAYGQFILWPKTYSNVKVNPEVNSLDGVLVVVEVSFQWLPHNAALYRLTKLYANLENYETVLKRYASSAIRDACAEYETLEFQTKRVQVQSSIYEHLAERIENLESDVIDVQLTFIDRPDDYEAAVDLKEAARNDIDQAENEREQALIQAETVLLEATTTAEKYLDTAQTNADNTLAYATAEAEAITDHYQTLAETFKAVRTTHSFSSEALLTYVATRLVDSAVGVTIGYDAPARVSYASELSSGTNSSS